MGGKNKAPPPPDYSGIANASSEAAQYSFTLGREQLAWAREQYYADRGVTDKIVAKASAAMDANDASARRDRERYENTYQPLEDSLVRDAAEYSTDARRDKDIGRAQSAVAQQFDQTRQAAMQQLEGFGIDPSSTRYAALDIGTRAAKAAAMAAAGNQAAERVDAMGRALRSEAINVGRGYPGQVAAQYGTALNAGNQAVNSQLAATASGAQTMGTANQWMGTGNQALGTWGNALTSGYNAQMQQFNANQKSSSGWGSALGLIGGIGLKAFGLAEGGEVPGEEYGEGGMEEGGIEYDENRMVPEHASPSQGKAIDDVPARLTAGEFVIPKEVVDFKGQEFFQRLIHKTRSAIDLETGGDGNIPNKPARPAIKHVPAEEPTYQSRTGIPMR